MTVGSGQQTSTALPSRLTWPESIVPLVFVALVGVFTTVAFQGNCTEGGIFSGGPVPAPEPGTPRADWCGHFYKLDGWVLTFAAVALATLGIVAVRRRFIPSLIVCAVAVVPSVAVAIVSANLSAYLDLTANLPV